MAHINDRAKTTTPYTDNILEMKKAVEKHFGEYWRTQLESKHGIDTIRESLLDPKMTKAKFLSTWYPKHF